MTGGNRGEPPEKAACEQELRKGSGLVDLWGRTRCKGLVVNVCMAHGGRREVQVTGNNEDGGEQRVT